MYILHVVAVFTEEIVGDVEEQRLREMRYTKDPSTGNWYTTAVSYPCEIKNGVDCNPFLSGYAHYMSTPYHGELQRG